MSLHVVPRGGGPPIEIDDERTSIDDNPSNALWEDGTTVEESTLAHGKAFRSNDGGGGSTTGTTGSGQTLDELTVEEHARPLPPLSLVPSAQASQAAASIGKLVVVAGSDAGREFDLVAGKLIAVGRAIDNDVVLTDISVSRKHFELLYEGDCWILRDRGSGNGTLINDRMEDGSCQLHHGDRLEIGNTVFRFDHPASAGHAAPVGWGQRDDDDASTVAGKAPSRDDLLLPGVPPGADPMNGPIARPVSTLPGPPPSSRKRAATRPPPLPRGTSSQQAVHNPPSQPPVPASNPNALTLAPGTVPPPYPMPMTAAAAPTMTPFGVPHPPPSQNPNDYPRLPVDYPMMQPEYGQGPLGSGVQAMRASGGIPYEPRAHGTAVARGGNRWIFGAAVIVIVAGIGVGAAALDGGAANEAKNPIGPLQRKKKGATPPPVSATAGTGGGAVVTDGAGSGSDGATQVAVAATPTPTTPTPTPPTAADPAVDKAAADKAAADKVAAEKAAADKAAADKIAADKAAADKIAADKAAADKAAADKAAADKIAADKAAADKIAADKIAAEKKAAADKRTADKSSAAERRAEQRRVEAERKAEARRRAEEKRERERDARAAREREREAAASKPGAIEAAQAKAKKQYDDGDPNAASKTLFAIASSADGGVATELRKDASSYKTVWLGLTAGKTAAQSKATETLNKLKAALKADDGFGGTYATEIKEALRIVAPLAAVQHMARDNFEAAFSAANDAQTYGAGNNSNVQTIRRSLERKAADLYGSGMKLLQSGQSADGKTQLQRVLKIVSKSNSYYTKARSALDSAK